MRTAMADPLDWFKGAVRVSIGCGGDVFVVV